MKPTGQLIGQNLDFAAEAMREAATLLANMRQENEQLKAVVEEQDHKLIDRAMALEEARKIIEALTDEDDCYLDHHGWCQTHFGREMQDGRCANAVGNEWMEATQ